MKLKAERELRAGEAESWRSGEQWGVSIDPRAKEKDARRVTPPIFNASSKIPLWLWSKPFWDFPFWGFLCTTHSSGRKKQRKHMGCGVVKTVLGFPILGFSVHHPFLGGGKTKKTYGLWCCQDRFGISHFGVFGAPPIPRGGEKQRKHMGCGVVKTVLGFPILVGFSVHLPF